MGSKSRSAPQGVPRTPVLLPGFCVTGTICVPQSQPHALWWSAYLAALLRGATLAELRARPPWPVPADTLLQRQLLHELLEQRWLHLCFATGALTVREDLAACFRAQGEEGLLENLQKVDTLSGEWWLDAVSGTFLARKTAEAFDYDLGRLPPDAIKLTPRLNKIPDEIDLADLLAKLGLTPAQRRVAYLRDALQLEEDKSLLFQVYGASERLLPDELSVLAPGLSCHAPQVLRPPGARITAIPAPAAPPRTSAGRATATAAAPSGAAPPPPPAQVAEDPRIDNRGAAAALAIEEVMAELRWIPAGRFVMGDDRVPHESPRHQVTLTRGFWMGCCPVTQELWQRVMQGLPHLEPWERGPKFPIIHVGYRDMQAFIDRLNARSRGGFALPTEAEWEYACRAGQGGDYSFQPARRISEYAWHKDNAEGRLHEVARLLPNAFGLFDMHGLVYETVRDGPRRYQDKPVTDPVGPIDGRNAVARGGGWTRAPFRGPRDTEGEHFRCASRQTHERSKRVGFRLLRYAEVNP